MRKSFIFLLVIVTILIFSIGFKQKIDLEKEKAKLIEVDRKFSRTSVEKGTFEAFYRFMADDVTILPKKGHPITGRETYRKLNAQRKETDTQSQLKWEPYFADISASADLGYTLGRYELTVTDSDGNKQVTYGYYVTIWKKQRDGGWKFVFDTGNESPPPEEKITK